MAGLLHVRQVPRIFIKSIRKALKDQITSNRYRTRRFRLSTRFLENNDLTDLTAWLCAFQRLLSASGLNYPAAEWYQHEIFSLPLNTLLPGLKAKNPSKHTPKIIEHKL